MNFKATYENIHRNASIRAIAHVVVAQNSRILDFKRKIGEWFHDFGSGMEVYVQPWELKGRPTSFELSAASDKTLSTEQLPSGNGAGSHIVVHDPTIHETLVLWLLMSKQIFNCLESSVGGEMEDGCRSPGDTWQLLLMLFTLVNSESEESDL